MLRRAWALALILAAALMSWTWWGRPPDLANAQASQHSLDVARTEAQSAAAARAIAQGLAPLEGPAGDIERRGAEIADPSARAALARDVELIADLAAAADAERAALQRLDGALMARTRDLGPRSEELRAATWPIVEQLKLYPPPLGANSDLQPPDAAFLRAQAELIRAGDPAAAVAVGQRTFALKTLLQADVDYAATLADYDAVLTAISAAPAPPASTPRLALAWLVWLAALGGLAWAVRCLGVGDDPALVGLAGGLALWWLPLPLPLVLLGGALLVAIVAWRPGLAALLPLLGLPLYYRLRTFGTLMFPINETLLALALLGLALAAGLDYARGWRPAPATWRPALRQAAPWLLLFATLVLAGWLSHSSPLLVEERAAAREWRRTLLEPTLWLALGLALLFGGLVRGRSLAWALVLPAAWIAGDGLVRFVRGEGIWATEAVPRLIGLLPSSTALGVYLGAAAAAACALVLQPESASDRRAAWGVAPLLLVAVALTFTRGAWLGLGATLLLLLVLTGRRTWAAGLVGAGLLGLGAAWLIAPGLAARVLRLNEGTGAARQEIWAGAWNAIEASPLLGAGLDQFAYLDAARFGIPQIRFLTLSHPHNLALDAWLQLGLLGLLALAALAILAAWRLWQRRQTLVGLVGLAVLAQLCLHGMVDQTLLGGDMIYSWVLVALLAAAPLTQQDERSPR